MFLRRLFGLGFIALIVVGLLTLSGIGAYRTGWSQGYVSGNIAADGEEAPAAPVAPYGYGRGYGFGFGPGILFFGFGLFFKLAFFFFLFMLLSKFLFWGRRGFAGGSGGKHWAKHKHHWQSQKAADEVDEDSASSGLI